MTLTRISCGNHASATATCKQERPKQGVRERPSKRRLKVTSMHMEVRCCLWPNRLARWHHQQLPKLALSRFLCSHWRCANTTGPHTFTVIRYKTWLESSQPRFLTWLKSNRVTKNHVLTRVTQSLKDCQMRLENLESAKPQRFMIKEVTAAMFHFIWRIAEITNFDFKKWWSNCQF